MKKKKNQKTLMGHGLILTCVLVLFVGVVQCMAADDCTITYRNPVIKYDHKDAEGRIYIAVENWAYYPNEMFRQAPELPPCGLNRTSSRTWVNIYNADTSAYIYGFCAINSNNGLTQLWFKPDAQTSRVYIVMEDRACKKSYKSNIITWGFPDDCTKTYPDPVIKFDHRDTEGRIYIQVVNWANYPNEMFREAPDLPPCGANSNSSRTWVNIYNADTNAYVYGFCALGSNNDLNQLWFSANAQANRVYIILEDRACKKNYKSNILSCAFPDDCTKTYPDPVIKFDHRDAEGRIYIQVVNWADYPNEMFRQAPDLPPCGANNNSSRTWVNIYNADTNAYVYGFCALGSNNDLNQLWFSANAQASRVYIIMEDRACKKSYKSNILTWGIQQLRKNLHKNRVKIKS